MFRQQHLANFITFARIVGVFFIVFVLTPYTTSYQLLVTVLLYTLICITDFLDGWIARRYSIVSELGKILDPLADKLLVLVLLPLLTMQVISSLPVFIILAREFAIMALRVFSAKSGTIISASTSGKFKTALTLPVCGILMARVPVEFVAIPSYLKWLEWLRLWVVSWPTIFVQMLVLLMVLVTVWSFFDYFIQFLWQRALARTKGNKEQAKKQLYVYIPNIISLVNLCCGVVSVYWSFINIKWAVAYILLGVVFDAFDGQVARKLGVYSKLGEKLDSKADIITFGVAPAFVLFNYFSSIGRPIPFVEYVVPVLFYVSVHYRLYRFDKGGHSDYFEGLPSPGGASISGVLVALSGWMPSLGVLLGVVVMMILMVSKVQYLHNRVAHKKMILSFVSKPTFIVWNLSILSLFGVPFLRELPLLEGLLIFTGIYVISPLIPFRKEFR